MESLHIGSRGDSQYASDSIERWRETARYTRPNMARVHITRTPRYRGYTAGRKRRPETTTMLLPPLKEPLNPGDGEEEDGKDDDNDEVNDVDHCGDATVRGCEPRLPVALLLSLPRLLLLRASFSCTFIPSILCLFDGEHPYFAANPFCRQPAA